eukprot:COSAG02_NODE_18146_length_958_cov_0.956927_1_plen_48_part_10
MVVVQPQDLSNWHAKGFTYCLNRRYFFKQKTAYEIRIRDWSSDVCSSD